MDKENIHLLAEAYKKFLDQGKTEREVVSFLEEQAIALGYQDLKKIEKLEEGQTFYFNHRNKCFFMGLKKSPLKEGFNLVAAHIDAPRLDLKGAPLYEEEGLALLKTHYYGGIKKYQWVTMPLALHGVVFKKDGTKLELRIGEEETDPVFTITDLLPHLGREQMAETMAKGIKGEQLNLLVGNKPVAKAKKDDKTPVKTFVLEYLKENYGMAEEDFLRSELEVVPAFKARDIGFDRSMIGAYGQDDRICTYALFKALVDGSGSGKTILAGFFDKEEIGSNGDTGAQSRIIEYLLELILEKSGETTTPLNVLYHSSAISADVSACDDPNHKGLFDTYNRPMLGKGVVLSKYTGSGGKYEANDASAEVMSKVMEVLDKKEVVYQAGELGKVDQGGGGTLACYLSQLGMEVLDMGPGLLSMHSPFEIASKGDLFMTYLAYKAFFEEYRGANERY